MNESILKLSSAFDQAMKIKPKAGGFPVLAEVLRQNGVKKNLWTLPSCQSFYIIETGPIVFQGEPLLSGMQEVHEFDEARLTKALRVDQKGESTFLEFLSSAWQAGVVSYTVDLEKRVCIYYGLHGETYEESYPEVDLSQYHQS